MTDKLRFLLLECNPTDIVTFENYLIKTKLSVDQCFKASSLKEALAVISIHQVDVMIINLLVPDSSGMATFNTLSNAAPSIPIIVCSDAVDSQLVAEVFRANGQDFLFKGKYDEHLLGRSIRSAIGRSQVQKTAERARRNYEALFYRNPRPMWAFDLDSLKIRMVNAAAISHYGYSEHEFLELSILDIQAEQPTGRGQRPVGPESVPPGSSSALTVQHKKKDGTIIDVEIAAQQIDFEGEQLILSVITDVTTRVEALVRLKESEERLNLAMMAGRMALLDVNYQTRELRFSAKESDIFGIPLHSVTQIEQALELIHPDDNGKLQEALKGRKPDEAWDVQFRVVMPGTGETLWLERRSYIICDENGVPLESRGIVLDITDMKKTQQELIKSYSEIEAAATQQAFILNSLPAQVALLNHEGMIVSVNEQWNRLTQDSEKNFPAPSIGQSYFCDGSSEFHGEDIRAGVKRVIDGVSYHFSAEYKTSSNDTWFRALASPLPSTGKQGAVVMVIDITEGKKLEDDLRTSRARLLSILDSTEDAYVLIDTDFRILAFNRRANANAVEFHQPPLVLGKSLLEYFTSGRFKDFQKYINDAYTKTVQYEVEYDLAPYGKRWFVTRITPVLANDQTVIGFTICGHEATNEKRAELSLRASEERFRSLIENSGDMFTIADTENRITYISPNIEKLLCYPQNSVLWQEFNLLIHPEDIESYKQVFCKVCETPNRPYHIFYRIKKSDGDFIWVEGTMVNLKAVPSVNGIVTNFRDISERIRIENELQQNKYILEKANQVAKIGYWAAGIGENAVLSWSPQMFKIFELSESEFDNRPQTFFSMIHPDDRAMVDQALEAAITGNDDYNVDHRIICRDGKVKWIYEQAEIFYDDAGNPVSIIGVSKDITERKTSEEEIRNGKNNLDALLNSTDDLIWSIDRDMKLISANLAFRQGIQIFYGVSISEGDSVLMMDKSDPALSEWTARYQQALAGERVNFDFAAAVGDQKKFFEVSMSPIRDREQLIGATCFTRDITSKKRVEQEIRAMNEQYQMLLKATNDAIWDWNLRDNSVQWSHGLKWIFGYDDHPDQKKLEWWESNVHPDDIQRVSKELSDIFEAKHSSWNSSYRFRCKDGSYKHVHDRGYILFGNGEPMRMIGAMQDVHELTEYRMSLEQKVNDRTRELQHAVEKEKELADMKSRFVSIASHEFRTPLSAIQFAADFIQLHRKKISDEEVDRKLESISGQINHMMSLLDDVLVVGKGDSGKIQVNMAPVNLKLFFGDLVANVRRASKSSHHIKTSYSLANEQVVTDEKLLYNIFSNLLSNAIKFSPGKKQVYLDCHHEPGALVIEVADEGIGINTAELDSLFEPFNRGANVGAIAGTGLGLTIVKTAVDLLGGELTVSSSVEFSTVFTVRLPC